ncbi:low temperature requirement protein A [Nocardioides sp.]|uniref:low temperature requirement protein A n=1 Tax=Nocardioides sp. TaxID=35761 RepID=UPI002ED0DC06
MAISPVPWSVPMGPRDTEEPHRAATPLELFFDLVFVVAIASAAGSLHHGLAEGHLEAIVYFCLVFFAVWWAWVGYTWFTSAYDSGDVIFRVLSLVIMAGSLLLAAGVPDLFADGQSALVVAGYSVMRLAMVSLWLRAAHGHPEGRRTAMTYAIGIAAVQALWLARLAIEDGRTVLLSTFLLLALLEVAVPYVAERAGRTPYHPEHIAERYGLFTIIVLGEVVLAAVVAVQGALGDEHGRDLVPLVVGGILLVFSMWWMYFKRDHAPLFAARRTVWRAAYAHAVGFATVAATGAGLAVAVDVTTHHAHATETVAVWSVAVPVGLYTVVLGVLHWLGDHDTRLALPAFVTAAAVLVVAALGLTLGLAIGVVVLLIGLVLALAVAQHVVASRSSEAAGLDDA